jgi:hypothetical protein
LRLEHGPRDDEVAAFAGGAARLGTRLGWWGGASAGESYDERRPELWTRAMK